MKMRAKNRRYCWHHHSNQLTYLSQLLVAGHLLPALRPAALADLLGDLGEGLGQLVLGQRLLPRLHVVGQVAVVALEAVLELLVIRCNCHSLGNQLGPSVNEICSIFVIFVKLVPSEVTSPAILLAYPTSVLT